MEVTTTGTSGSFVTGTTSGTVTTYNASCYSDIDGSVIATLRSRAVYGGDQILDFEVSGVTDTEMTNTTDIVSDPFASFSITGTASDVATFSYSVSMDKSKKNYLPGVFGSKSQDKETELFVEEIYHNVLDDLYAAGKVKGLDITFNGIGEGSSNNLDDYQEQWKSASSPYVLSELRGNKLQRLFRFITISDGDAANEDVKFSIINIKPDDKTFDLAIRKFNDNDSNM